MSCCDKHLLKTSLPRYKYPELVWKDISTAQRQFTDLYPSEKTFVFNDGTKQNLVQFEGTIPVPYKGNVYNIPVQLWLLDSHPYDPPMVYVRPTSTMNIRAGRYVDMNGKVDMPFLQQWKWPDSDLLGLIQILIVIFGEECPLFSKVIRPQVQTTQPNPRSSYGTLTSPREINMLTEDNTTIMTAVKAEMSALKISDTDLSGSNVTQDQLMKDLLHANYKNPDLASRDVVHALHHYRDLRPSLQQFYFNDGTKQQLLQLSGTIPGTI
ncbi:tumor susceptibility gene 101 protein-like isoform X2 [Pomacea canaliculata]|uniref:tumor susceptibility gene 101 protein-like isoform X2 n=1 Tax=Pomacea canaliculata TaxID=400727 RepID=UPI000D729035|nr:tumor susceptibility gene 101 protein-like isoform X2 [Pomacea canaliculata]